LSTAWTITPAAVAIAPIAAPMIAAIPLDKRTPHLGCIVPGAAIGLAWIRKVRQSRLDKSWIEARVNTGLASEQSAPAHNRGSVRTSRGSPHIHSP
jgi:hypothetical protein